jgi:3-hydroxyacyl-[acyl-carrier-protein] dehydratase
MILVKMAENLLHHPITSPKEIIDLIPQKEPFVFVDALYEYTRLTGVTGFTIPENNVLLDDGKLAESGLIEHMAQSMSLHRGYQGTLEGQKKPKTGFIGVIKTVEILELPKVGEKLKTYVEILHEIMNVTSVSARTENERGEVIATSEMKTVTVK